MERDRAETLGSLLVSLLTTPVPFVAIKCPPRDKEDAKRVTQPPTGTVNFLSTTLGAPSSVRSSFTPRIDLTDAECAGSLSSLAATMWAYRCPLSLRRSASLPPRSLPSPVQLLPRLRRSLWIPRT